MVLELSVYVLLVLGLAGLTLHRPAYALAVVICSFGLEQWSQSIHDVFVTHNRIGNFVTAGILMLGLATRFLRQEPLFRNFPAAFWWITGLYLWSILSIVWSVYPEGGSSNWRMVWPYVVLTVFLTSLLFHSAEELRDGVMATLGFGALLAFVLILTTTVAGRQIEIQYGRYELRSTMANPLAIARMAGTVALVATLLNFRGTARFWQLLRWVVVAIGAALILRSESRGEFIGMLLTAVVFLPISRRAASFKGILTTAFALLVIGVVARILFELLAAGNPRWELEEMRGALEEARGQRVLLLLSYWAHAGPFRWLMGLGTSASYDPDIVGFYTHMVPVEIMCEEGLLGLGAFLVICLVSVRAFLRAHRVVRDDPRQLGVLCVLGALFFYRLVLCNKTGSFLSAHDLFLFAVLLGKFELATRRHGMAVPAGPQPSATRLAFSPGPGVT